MPDTPATRASVKAPQTPIPAHPHRTLRDEIDRLFDEFDGFGRWAFPRTSLGSALAARSALAPAVDIVETDKAFEVSVELPGLTEHDIQVDLINGDLRITGEKKEVRTEKDEGRYLSERRYGAFERRFTLPDGVDAEKIEAAFTNGVLTVTMAKSAQAQNAPKKIAVKQA